MLSKEVKVNNQSGLHARPAAEVSKLAAKFESKIMIESQEKLINAKSIMAVMTSQIQGGSRIMLQIEGVDEREALVELSGLIEYGLSD